MNLKVKHLLLFILSVSSLMITRGFTQTGQTGSIKGTVTGPEGAPLPGITVTLKSPAIVVNRLVTVSNENGRYHFPALAPGAYDITYRLEGMNTLVRRGITVSIGKAMTVDAEMNFKTVEEEIIVEGQAPTIDRQQNTRATTMNIKFLDAIPSVRDLNSYFNMAPGVTSDSAHGSSTIENSYNMDGVNMTDPTIGLQYVSFGMEAAEEISVQSGALSAEYGSVKGAAVNIVTKSGGNTLSGSASFYFQHEDLQSTNTDDTPLSVS